MSPLPDEKRLYTTRQYPCGCKSEGPGDVPNYCSEHEPRRDELGHTLLGQIEARDEVIKTLRCALEDISKGNGAFSVDQYLFACNVIESMKSIALKALAGTYERE